MKKTYCDICGKEGGDSFYALPHIGHVLIKPQSQDICLSCLISALTYLREEKKNEKARMEKD